MASARTQYYAKKLFEICGLLPIGAFLIEHLYTNFQAVGEEGAKRFDHIVQDLQSNPMIIFLEIGAIGLPLLYHAGYGLFVAAKARHNAGAYSYLRNWAFTLQRLTGAVVLLYICYHVWNTRLSPMFYPENPLFQQVNGKPLVSSAYMHDYINDSHAHVPVLWIYIVGVSATIFHFSNGLWNAGIHWGLTVSPRSQKISGLVCTAVGLTLLALGMASLFAFKAMD